MKPIVIIKTGSTFPATKEKFGDFEDWIIAGCASKTTDFTVIDVNNGQELPATAQISGVIITGSHAMVTDRTAWMRKLEAWVTSIVECDIPLLGICFGHQLLAQAMGGVVAYHGGGREIGTVPINLTQEGKHDPLLGTLPTMFMGHTTHAQTIQKLPAGALLLAKNSFEPHHAYRVAKSAWGVQFHPEFTDSIMNEYVNEQAETLTNNGIDLKTLQSEIANTAEANRLLNRFIEITREFYS